MTTLSSYTQTTFSFLEVMNNEFMSSIICCVLCTFVHRFICLSLAWENYWMYRLVLNNNRHEKPHREFQHNRLTSFWKNMLSLIFFLLISMAREEHDDTVDRVAIFRLKCWISRGGSILASSSRQASSHNKQTDYTSANRPISLFQSSPLPIQQLADTIFKLWKVGVSKKLNRCA